MNRREIVETILMEYGAGTTYWAAVDIYEKRRHYVRPKNKYEGRRARLPLTILEWGHLKRNCLAGREP